jgi:hypothetical protein
LAFTVIYKSSSETEVTIEEREKNYATGRAVPGTTQTYKPVGVATK